MSRTKIWCLGILACFGAIMAIVADMLSVWSSAPHNMQSALSIDLSSIQGLYVGKPRWTFVLGNYLGVAFLPFHMLGFLLIHEAVKSAGKLHGLVFISGAFYFVAIGAGYHGTFAFIGDIIQSGDSTLLKNVTPYWLAWGLALTIGYIVLCFYLMALILSGRTLYKRWSAALTPLPLMALTAAIVNFLPSDANALKAALTVTGLNFPLLVFFIFTIYVLLSRSNEK